MQWQWRWSAAEISRFSEKFGDFMYLISCSSYIIDRCVESDGRRYEVGVGGASKEERNQVLLNRGKMGSLELSIKWVSGEIGI